MTTHAESAVLAGGLLGDRYQLEERVAAGGMGEVWRATDPLLVRPVAIKLLRPGQDATSGFRTEARLLASLRHPGIVRAYDYGTDGQDYLVMEYLDGEPLNRRIAAAGRLGSAEALSVLGRAAEALQVAHRAGIVHRDVKPGNLMIQPDGHVVLMDFGLARPMTTAEPPSRLLAGSPHYMAPEQVTGAPMTPATDVYALGAVGYACLTGRAPFLGDSPAEILGQVVHRTPAPLARGVPPGVARVVLRALSKDPDERYSDAAEFAAAVRGTRLGWARRFRPNHGS